MSSQASGIDPGEAIARIVSNWHPSFTTGFRGRLPDSYLCLDTETSGLSPERDVIVQFGHCLVQNNKVVDRGAVTLNWFKSQTVPERWLRAQLLELEQIMSRDGRAWHITEEMMKAEGVDPIEGLTFVFDFLSELQSRGTVFVAHNGRRFDCAMLLAAFNQDLQKEFEFGPHQIFDTGCLVKASRLWEDPTTHARRDETPWEYFDRIAGIKSRVRWSLDGVCVDLFKLKEKYGVDKAKMHDAGEDAYVLHLLMQEFHAALAKYKPVGPPVAAGQTVLVRPTTAQPVVKAAPLNVAGPIYRTGVRNR